MKTMTCRQLGGPCDYAMHGDTADEIIKAGEKHIIEMVTGGDESHKAAKDMMDKMRQNPASGMGWYAKTQKDIAELPED